MRKIIVEAEISVDGGMGGDNAAFWGQVFAFHTQDVKDYLNDLLFMPDALLMGRVTYESWAQLWPTRQGKDADKINGMPKYVASKTLKGPLQWNSTLLKGDTAEAIQKLKQEPGGNLLQYGVGDLTHTLFQNGHVDELRLIVFPFAFGEGRRIFDQMGVNTFKLLDTQTFNSGAVVLRYQPDKPQ